jgi:hypothetical protein
MSLLHVGCKSGLTFKARKIVGYGLSLGLAMALAGGVRAQGQPGNGPPNNAPPRPGQNDANASDANSDFPGVEVRGAVEANARAAFARASFHRLQDSMDSMILRMQYDFEHSKDLADASKAEQHAWDAYLAARKDALKSVVNDPKYVANVELKDAMGHQIAEIRATYSKVGSAEHRSQSFVNAAMMKQLVEMATVKLDYAQVATDMEVAALRNNVEVADARQKLMSAGARVAELRDEFDRKVRDSKELAAVREQIEDARVQYITAEAFRSGAVDAANMALDYAYYKNRFSNSYAAYPMDFSYVGYGYGRPIYRY